MSNCNKHKGNCGCTPSCNSSIGGLSCADIRKCETLTKLTIVDGIITFIDEKNQTFIYNTGDLFDETLTSLTFDTDSNTLTYIDENLDSHDLELNEFVPEPPELFRFAIEDNVATLERYMDMELRSITLENPADETEDIYNKFIVGRDGLYNQSSNFDGSLASTFTQNQNGFNFTISDSVNATAINATAQQSTLTTPLLQIVLPAGSFPGAVLTDVNGDGYATWEDSCCDDIGGELDIRFGIEDNVATQERYVDMELFSLTLENLPDDTEDIYNKFVVGKNGLYNSSTNADGSVGTTYIQTQNGFSLHSGDSVDTTALDISATETILQTPILQIDIPSKADTYILTSDANGFATWQPAPGGTTILLQTNTVNNGSQTLLNLKNGTGITITDDGSGGITFDGVLDWHILGNSGTAFGTNFVGTTDTQSLEFRANNIRGGYIDHTTNGNAAFGLRALNVVTIGSGQFNTALGYEALKLNTTLDRNTAIGYQALAAQVASGGQNTAVGSQALTASIGNSNVALGDSAMLAATTANSNVAVGLFSLGSTLTGSNNVALGSSALSSATGNIQMNTAVGNYALRDNTASSNVAVGFEAAKLNTSGAQNTLVGWRALTTNTTGSNNTGVGYSALFAATTGAANTGVGVNALLNNTTGLQNTAIGYQALKGAAGMTGSNNVAVGLESMQFLTTGSGNIGIGPQPIQNVTTGSWNIALGQWAGFDITTGSNNTLIGLNAGNRLTTGTFNVSISQGVDTDNNGLRLGASKNVVLGAFAGGENMSGSFNTFVGAESGGLVDGSDVSGNYNTIVGYKAGKVSGGLANVTLLGAWSSPVGANGNAQLNICNAIYGVGMYATAAQSSVAVADSKIGFGVASPTAQVHIAGSTTARAAMNLVVGAAPTTPNNGDIWFDGTDLKMRIGGVTKTFTLV